MHENCLEAYRLYAKKLIEEEIIQANAIVKEDPPQVISNLQEKVEDTPIQSKKVEEKIEEAPTLKESIQPAIEVKKEAKPENPKDFKQPDIVINEKPKNSEPKLEKIEPKIQEKTQAKVVSEKKEAAVTQETKQKENFAENSKRTVRTSMRGSYYFFTILT